MIHFAWPTPQQIQAVSRLSIACLLLSALAAGVFCPAWGQDFGDHTSATLASKAWQALGEGKHDLVAAYTNKCRELYEGEATKQQASLTGFAPADQAHSYWALNDVGTCLFIAAESLAQQGKSKEAVATYEKLVDDFGYCQCWDTKGWFWKPAEAASRKLKQLEFDAKLE